MNQILTRDSGTFTDVDTRRRIIELIAVPWEQEAPVVVRGESWREVFTRGAFDAQSGATIRVNREHERGRTVGKVVEMDPGHASGLHATVKVANTEAGDEVLALASEDMVSASIGYGVRSPSDVQMDRQTRLRRVNRAFLDHLSLVESPAFAGAQVLAVRGQTRRPVLADPILAWAAIRVLATRP